MKWNKFHSPSRDKLSLLFFVKVLFLESRPLYRECFRACCTISLFLSHYQSFEAPWGPGRAPGSRFHESVAALLWLWSPGVSHSRSSAHSSNLFKLPFKCSHQFMALGFCPSYVELGWYIFLDAPVSPNFRMAVCPKTSVLL